MNPEADYGMKGQIDKLWHEFNLFTEAYAIFCQNVSGRFLHHRPHVPGQIDADKSANGYERFLADYEATYGESAPAGIWPRASDEPPGTLGDAPTTSPCDCYVAPTSDAFRNRWNASRTSVEMKLPTRQNLPPPVAAVRPQRAGASSCLRQVREADAA